MVYQVLLAPTICFCPDYLEHGVLNSSNLFFVVAVPSLGFVFVLIT